MLPMELHWLPEAEERLDRLLSPLLGRIAACSAAGIHKSQCQRTAARPGVQGVASDRSSSNIS